MTAELREKVAREVAPVAFAQEDASGEMSGQIKLAEFERIGAVRNALATADRIIALLPPAPEPKSDLVGVLREATAALANLASDYVADAETTELLDAINSVRAALALIEGRERDDSSVDEIGVSPAGRTEAQHSAGWRCKARHSNLPDPQDCDWPLCGCDPVADKVISALEEMSLLPPAEVLQERAKGLCEELDVFFRTEAAWLNRLPVPTTGATARLIQTDIARMNYEALRDLIFPAKPNLRIPSEASAGNAGLDEQNLSPEGRETDHG